MAENNNNFTKDNYPMGRLSRRNVLKAGAGAFVASSLPLNGLYTFAAEKRPPKTTGNHPVVVIARNEKVWNGNSLDAKVVERLLHDAVRTLSGAENTEEAWRAFFGPRDDVGLKLNCLGGRNLSPRPELVKALCKGIGMAGVAESNMLLWDQTDRDLGKAGYRVVTSGNGIRCYGTDNQERSMEAAYDRELTEKGAVGCLVSGIASRKCNALVNVCILKDHDLAGVSISLKNYYGAIHNPNKYHANNCSPFVADVYSFSSLGGKTRLVVCDATTAQCNGGPGFKENWAWKFGGILVATDPVALDSVGHSIIAEKRRQMGLPTLEKAERPPKHIAAAAKRGLGENDLKKIKVIKIS